MNKWLNKQKPITLGFITAITCYMSCYMMSCYTETEFKQLTVLKFCGSISLLVFFMSWMMFYQGEKSSKIFKEIDELYYSAKKVKTKTELTKVIKEYNNLRERADDQGHYAQLNIVKGVLETKQEYL